MNKQQHQIDEGMFNRRLVNTHKSITKRSQSTQSHCSTNTTAVERYVCHSRSVRFLVGYVTLSIFCVGQMKCSGQIHAAAFAVTKPLHDNFFPVHGHSCFMTVPDFGIWDIWNFSNVVL